MFLTKSVERNLAYGVCVDVASWSLLLPLPNSLK